MEVNLENFIKKLVRRTVVQTLDGIQQKKGSGTYVVANWKMNHTLSETTEFFQNISFNNSSITVVVCPSAPLLYQAALLIKRLKRPIRLGSQDVHWADKGAYTGEISAAMVRNLHCEYVIIGHSERRIYASENNDIVNKKAKQAIKYGLTPIICIGETLAEKNELLAEQVLSNQLFEGLSTLDSNQFIIAYEPLWAIGTGVPATAEVAQERHAYIRSVLKSIFKEDFQNIPILYGGSVNEQNAIEYSLMPDIDGVLVGNASLRAESFQKIIDSFTKGVRTHGENCNW